MHTAALAAKLLLKYILCLLDICALQALPSNHRISDQLRSEVQQQLLLGVPTREIQQRCRDKLLDQFMSEHKLTDRNHALTEYCSSQPPRDWHLSAQDINNIRREADRCTWRFHEDPQTSVRMWVTQNPGAVLYMEEQEPIEGTPDYAFVHRAQQAAAAAATAKGSQVGLSKQGSVHGSGEDAGAEDGSARCQDEVVGAATEEPFAGANDRLDRPELINLERADCPALLQYSCVDGTGAPIDFNPLNWKPFTIAVMPPENVAVAIKLGHGRSLQLDSTFGSNAQKFPFFTLLAVDKHGKGVPLAYLICSHEREDLIQRFLEAVRDEVLAYLNFLRFCTQAQPTIYKLVEHLVQIMYSIIHAIACRFGKSCLSGSPAQS